MEPFGSHLDGFQDVADQLADHLRGRSEAALALAEAEKCALDSPEAFAARRARLREMVRAALGGLPEAAAASAVRVAGSVDQGAFTIERVLLETLPGVKATCNVYVPRGAGAASRRPGVLFVCGHAREAKAAPVYQRVCRSLARAGMVVLSLDPVGQGERLQYVDPATRALRVEWGTTEHSHAGFQCHVAGFGIARYFIADAMAALGYLAARPDVDPMRLGVTGSSGGGTQSSYMTFLDDRLACGAPCTYVTTRLAYMATGQSHDAEQNILGAVAPGLEHDDLLAGLAPKPVMIGAAASDYFCIEGAVAAFERLQRTYALYGRSEEVYLVVAPGTHAYSPTLRDRVTAFFRRHLLGEDVALKRGLSVYASAVESPVAPAAPLQLGDEDALDPAALNVTPSGQVAVDHPEARSVFALNLEAWRGRTGDGTAEDARVRLASAVIGQRIRPPMWVREIRFGEDGGLRWGHRYTFTEPGIAVSMIEVRRTGEAGGTAGAGGTDAGTILVVALPEGTRAVASREGDVRRLAGQAGRLLLFDPRGSGAVAQRSLTSERASGLFGTLYKLNCDAMMLRDSVFAMRVFDALRVLEYAHRISSAVEVYGEGDAGLVLLAAAALDGDVRGGRFAELLRSFDDLITDPLARPRPELEMHGLALLPDVATLVRMVPRCAVTSWVDGRGARV